MKETEFELPEANCLRCGRSWNPRAKNPKKCIYCGSKYWNIPFKELPKRLKVRLRNMGKGKDAVPAGG